MKTLKTNLLGILAIALAFGLTLSLSAFTSAETKRVSYTFYYDGPVPGTIAEVQDVDNWRYDQVGEPCNDQDETACSITIDESYVDDTNPSAPILLSTAELEAADHPTLSSAFVTASADTNMQIENKTL